MRTIGIKVLMEMDEETGDASTNIKITGKPSAIELVGLLELAKRSVQDEAFNPKGEEPPNLAHDHEDEFWGASERLAEEADNSFVEGIGMFLHLTEHHGIGPKEIQETSAQEDFELHAHLHNRQANGSLPPEPQDGKPEPPAPSMEPKPFPDFSGKKSRSHNWYDPDADDEERHAAHPLLSCEEYSKEMNNL